LILYDTTVKIKRLKTTSGNTRALVATATGEASIQPVAKESSAIADGQYGTLYVAYVEVDLPAQPGDTLTDPDGTVYSVIQTITRDTTPLPHKELTLQRQSK